MSRFTSPGTSSPPPSLWVRAGVSDSFPKVGDRKEKLTTLEKPGKHYLNQVLSLNILDINHVDVMYPFTIWDQHFTHTQPEWYACQATLSKQTGLGSWTTVGLKSLSFSGNVFDASGSRETALQESWIGVCFSKSLHLCLGNSASWTGSPDPVLCGPVLWKHLPQNVLGLPLGDSVHQDPLSPFLPFRALSYSCEDHTKCGEVFDTVSVWLK